MAHVVDRKMDLFACIFTLIYKSNSLSQRKTVSLFPFLSPVIFYVVNILLHNVRLLCRGLLSSRQPKRVDQTVSRLPPMNNLWLLIFPHINEMMDLCQCDSTRRSHCWLWWCRAFLLVRNVSRLSQNAFVRSVSRRVPE